MLETLMGGPWGAIAAASDEMGSLWNFKRGNSFDAQVQYGGSTDYGNYAFGVYMAAAGFSLQDTLGGANDYGRAFSHYPAGLYVMDVPDYPNIPIQNANMITQGYQDEVNGTM